MAKEFANVTTSAAFAFLLFGCFLTNGKVSASEFEIQGIAEFSGKYGLPTYRESRQFHLSISGKAWLIESWVSTPGGKPSVVLTTGSPDGDQVFATTVTISTRTSRKGKLQESAKPSTLGTVSSNSVPWQSHDRLALPLFLMFCAPFCQNSNQGSLPPYHEWALDASWRKHESIPASWDCNTSPPHLPNSLVYFYPGEQPNDTNALFEAKSFRAVGGLKIPEEFNFSHFKINPGFGPRLTEASRLHVVVTDMRDKCTQRDFRPKLEGAASVVDRRLRDSNGAEISVPYRVRFKKWLSPEQVETVRRGGNPYRIYSVLAISGWVLLALAPGILIVSLKLKKRWRKTS